MGLLLLGLLLLLPCLSSLPFYNGIYYSNRPHRANPGDGEGANMTLPCRYPYEPALVSPRPVCTKWWKLSENGAPEQDVLVAIGLRHYSFSDYRCHVCLRQIEERKVLLEIRDLQLEDDGHYRCEVIDGLEDESGLVELELWVWYFPTSPARGATSSISTRPSRPARPRAPLWPPSLFLAWEEGLDWCNAGWPQDASLQYPIALARRPCGGPGLAPGVRSYRLRHRRLHRHAVFCFAAALKGQVCYLEHPGRLTLLEGRRPAGRTAP